MLVRVSILDWHFTDGSSDLRKQRPNWPNSLRCDTRGVPRVWGEHTGELASLPAEAADRKDFLQKASPALRVSCGRKSDFYHS